MKKYTIENLTSAEQNLLLYCETRAVDHGGFLDTKQINADDIAIGKRWNEEGFMTFKRATKRNFDGDIKALTYKVSLTDAAWKIVAKLRRERAIRLA